MARKTSWFLTLKSPKRNPFGVAPLGAESNTASDDLTLGQRVIRNQILTRGAPIAGRRLIAAGAIAVAAGSARSSNRPKRRFSVITEKTARTTGQYRSDTTYYKRSSVTRRRKQIGYQERRALGRNAKPRGSMLKAGGTALIIGGKALPVIVYGYIGYDLYQRGATPNEARREIETATFGTSVPDAIYTAYSAYTIAKPFVNLGLTVGEQIFA